MTTRFAVVVGLVLGLGAGCTREVKTRGGAFDWFHNVPLYRTPADRCAASTQQRHRHEACVEARMLGDIYVRKLSVGDEVCLEAGFGEPPRGECQARAAVMDTATDKVLLELREAHPSSTWFNQEQRQFWFEEGALVDLYLKDHGY